MSKKIENISVKTLACIAIPTNLVDEHVISFANIVKEMAELYAKKNHDYGNSFEEGCDKIGSGYPLGRLLDKLNRLIACIGKEETMQINESIEDTLKDLGCYSIMTLSYLKRRKNGKSLIYN